MTAANCVAVFSGSIFCIRIHCKKNEDIVIKYEKETNTRKVFPLGQSRHVFSERKHFYHSI